MTTATAPAPGRATTHATLSRLTFGGLLRSEWIKLRSLRSTFWCFLLILLLNVGFALLVAAAGIGTPNGPGEAAAGEAGMAGATTAVTLGVNFTGLIAAVLGALIITGEYGTGMIKSTFTADPRRLGAVFAKGIVLAVSTFVVGFVSLIVSALASSGLLDSKSGISLDWSDGTFWLALVGGAAYLALAGLLAFGIGAIVRASAGGIAAGIGLLFVAQIVMQIIVAVTGNAAWAQNVNAFLPSTAGGLMFGYGAGTTSVSDGVVTLDQTLGALVMVGWVAISLVVAMVLVKRRDA